MAMIKPLDTDHSHLGPQPCAVCGKLVTGYCRVDSWGQFYHSEHEFKPCVNCGRIVSLNDTYLPHNRQVCSHCIDKVVRSDAHIAWVYERVQDIFERNFLALPAKIDVEIVNSTRMEELARKSNLSQLPTGLTFSQGVGFFGSSMQHKVYMLDYLHKVVFGGVLAHELLHVWQNEHRIKLSPPHCEGFCNLGTYLFYTYLNNELSVKLADALMNNPDPIYGDGLREVKRIFETQGGRNLERTIKLLR